MDTVRRTGGDSIARFLQRAFICLLVLLTLGLGLNLYALTSVRESFRQTATATIELTTAHYRLLFGMTEQGNALRAYLAGDDQQLATLARLNATMQDEFRRVDALPVSIVSPDVRLLVDRQRIAAARWTREVAEPAIQQRRAGVAMPPEAASPPGSDPVLEFRIANQALDALIAERRARDEATGTAQVQSLTALLVAGSLILMIGWAFVLWQIKRRVRRPLAALVAAAESVAAGRRSISVDVPHRDEFAVMAASLEAMVAAIRRQEIELASQMRHRDTILEHMAEGLVATEPDGCVVLLNPAAVYLLGIEDAENPREAAAAVLAELLAYDQYDEPDIGQARVVQLGDRSLSIISSPVPASEGIDLGIVHVVRDVTDLERIDRMKSEFIALVSHELRTPLTSIRGFTELILDGDAGEISDEIASYLMTVRSNTDRLVTLVNDLLDISRIEAGRVTLKLDRLDLGALLREAASLIQPQLTASRQRFALELPAFLPRLYADHDRLIQVMVNLLSNAHKYSGEEKPIRLSAEWREGTVRIAVTDEGIGISSENQRRLFTNFFRADDIEVRKVHGTGLGLAISRALVEMHGGHIEVSSRVGVGSTFTVVLPVVFQASGRGGDQPVGTAQRILVVDEDPAAAALVRRSLEQAGYAVHVATSDHGAIDVVRANPIDLVVLDLLMPRLSGFEAIDRLREHPASSSTPIVVLSIQPDPIQSVRLAPAAVLAKPADEQQILDATVKAVGEPGGQRVLIICGEASTRALATIVLRGAGYEPLAVGDESRGVQLAHDWSPDAIIGDLSMPGAQGVELVERLKSDSATCELPLIVFSPGDPRALHDVYALSRAELSATSEPLEGLVEAVRHVLEQLAAVGAG